MNEEQLLKDIDELTLRTLRTHKELPVTGFWTFPDTLLQQAHHLADWTQTYRLRRDFSTLVMGVLARLQNLAGRPITGEDLETKSGLSALIELFEE